MLSARRSLQVREKVFASSTIEYRAGISRVERWVLYVDGRSGPLLELRSIFLETRLPLWFSDNSRCTRDEERIF